MPIPITLAGRRHIGAALAALLLALVHESPAWACSCVGSSDTEAEIQAAVDRADVVFEGRATDVEALQAELTVTDYLGALRFRFGVTRYFKGQLGPNVDVFTIDQSSACGRAYTLGEPYVIYARYSTSGLLSDFLCSRSRPVSHASEDLERIGAGVEPDPSLVDEGVNDGDSASGIGRFPVSAESGSGCAASLTGVPPAPSLVGVPPVPRWLALAALLGGVVWRRSLRQRSRRSL
jgi:hypothetical protein